MNYAQALLCGMLIAPIALSGPGFAANRPPPGKTVTTRFGVLEFTVPFADGYPTPSTVDKLYAELDFQRATQVYLWSLPLVGFAQWQHEHRSVFRAGNGDVVSYRTFDDKLGLITANATTPYLIAFADLGEEGPMVLEVPAQGLTGSVLDYWQRPVDAPAINLVGKFLLLGPEQVNPKDSSLTAIRATTNNVFFGFRALGTDEKELEAALGGLKIYPYARRSAPIAARILSPEGRKWSGTQPRGLDYWRRLKEAIDSEPVAERDRFFMGMLKSIGIEKGKPFEPTPAQRQVLEEAALAGEAMAKANTFDKRIADPFWPGSHWKLAMHLEPSQRTENYDQLDERAAWFYEAVTASENMTGRHAGVGSTYLGAYRDSTGDWLDGGRFYRLRVPANAPAKNFWSVTVYDVNTRCFIDTQWKIADRSSRQDLAKNPDGSVDLYIGPRPPGDPARRRNWIPSVAGKAWFTYLRLYGPLQSYFDKTWVAPDIEAMRAWE